MNHERLYMIEPKPGFTPQMGRLVSMMEYVRWSTLEAVKELRVEQLDFLLDEKSNSIGAILKHIAAVEFVFYLRTIEKRGMTEEERTEWGSALELGARGQNEIKGNSLDYYTDVLNKVREKTFKAFSELTDEWLEQSVPEPRYGNRLVNYYYRWFHVFEDELNHRGQIRLIRKRILEG
ncbi:MAG: DinB family protein [Firmicutes bacterium]|nr:DinB family protein [Bacillota bacterium]